MWSDLSGPRSALGELPSKARTVVRYALTEMVNNAIDHSGAPRVEVGCSLEGEILVLTVVDKGVGIFRHVRRRLELPSELEALQELSKGKITTMPERHTGEGIFFTARAVQRFEIESGTLKWVVENRQGDMAVGSLDLPVEGTTVRMEVDASKVRNLTGVFAEYSDGFEFSKTRIVIKLFAVETEFVSRSQAKRLVHGLERFREVVLDFQGVNLVGQGFADEVFRVWARQHPEVKLFPVGMSEPIAFMVRRAQKGGALLGPDPG